MHTFPITIMFYHYGRKIVQYIYGYQRLPARSVIIAIYYVFKSLFACAESSEIRTMKNGLTFIFNAEAKSSVHLNYAKTYVGI